MCDTALGPATVIISIISVCEVQVRHAGRAAKRGLRGAQPLV